MEQLQRQKLMFKLKFLDLTKWVSFLIEDDAEPESIFLSVINLGKLKFPNLASYPPEEVELVCQGGVLETEIIGDFLRENRSCTIELVPKTPILFEVSPDNSLVALSPKPCTTSSMSELTPSTSYETVSSLPSSSSGQTPIFSSDLTQRIKSHMVTKPGGNELLKTHSESDEALSETKRRKVINLIVDHMVESSGCYPIKEVKINYAKSAIILFPQLKDSFTKEGYEMLYDPISHTGYFEWRLKTIRRSCLTESEKKQKSSKRKLIYEESLEISHEKRQRLEEEVCWLVNADPHSQTEEIKDRMAQTFPLREEQRKDPTQSTSLLATFPRFLDTPGLLSLEFELLKPDTPQFPDKFDKIQDKIYEVYNSYKSKTSEHEEHLEDWNKSTKSILYLLHLLPPTARGKKKGARSTLLDAANRLVLWNKTGISLEETVTEATATQPFLLACGPHKSTISDYFIIIDKKCVPCGKVSATQAFDLLFKAHYVFNCEFDSTLTPFYIFMGQFFYGIESDSLTPRIREIRKLLSL